MCYLRHVITLVRVSRRTTPKPAMLLNTDVGLAKQYNENQSDLRGSLTLRTVPKVPFRRSGGSWDRSPTLRYGSR